MDKSLISPIFNIIGLSFDIIGVLIVTSSLLTKEHFSTLAELFLKFTKQLSSKEKLPLDSKSWFFERILKEILAYTGSSTIDPKGFRCTVGFLFILFGFLLQILGNVFLFVSFKSLFLFLIIIYSTFFILFSRNRLIKTHINFYKKLKGDSEKYFNLKAKVFNHIKAFIGALFALNISFLFVIIARIFISLFKFGRWILSLGISKEERDHVKEEAFKEFKDKYGDEWENISNDLFKKS